MSQPLPPRIWGCSLLILITATSSITACAVTHVWSGPEVECALTMGFDPRTAIDLRSPNVIKHLTWVAHAVVIGTVADIVHEPRAAYHTTARIAVSDTLKGSVPATVLVKLLAGPAYDKINREIVRMSVPGEATFAVGERVLLFLNKDYPRKPDEPTLYQLGDAEFGLVALTKYTIADGQCVEAETGSGVSISAAIAMVSEAVTKQATLCD